jgi:hypothetical protein
MKLRSVRKFLAVSLLAIVAVFFLLAVGPFAGSDSPASPNHVIALESPSFLGVANAAPAPESTAITSFLEDEAGMAAYTHTVSSIDLSAIRDVFRTIEYETSGYIIGSVEVPDYPESQDVHVYVHTDGWVVAYYLAGDPVAKIVDARHYDGVEITTTKLENAMNEILTPLGAVPFEPSYYDFRYPNATDLFLIADVMYDQGVDSFDVQIPSEYTYYERSWWSAVYDEGSYDSNARFYISGNLISELVAYYGWSDNWGTLTPTQLPPATYSTYQVDFYDDRGGHALGGIALIYSEGP